MRTLAITLALAGLATPAFSQSLGYSDADNPGEAVGMTNTTLVTTRKMFVECSARFPEHEAEMHKNLREWEEKERAVIIKTRYHWARASKRDSKLLELGPYYETVVETHLKTVALMPGVDGTSAVSDYCRKHFSNLASGIWRTRTPRAYRFLDEAPAVPE